LRTRRVGALEAADVRKAVSVTPTLRDRLEFALYRAISTALRALPERPAIALGGALGWFGGAVLRIRRRVVDENLARAFPDRDERWRRRVGLESYRHLGREAVVAFRLPRETPERVLAHTEVTGMDALLEAARGPGAIIATGHLGSWEVAAAALALRGAPIDGIAVRQRNPLFDAELRRNRESLGARVVYRGVTGGDVLRSLREGRVPVMLADQDGGAGGIFVEFLGHPASTTRGPALLAVRSGARLFGGAFLVLPGRPRRYRGHAQPIDVTRTGDVAEDVRRLTQAYSDCLAELVREFPEQYFWQHKRWKTRPDAENQERHPVRAV
jgi:KDO2-lipid IV(A) lauroyltransferase